MFYESRVLPLNGQHNLVVYCGMLILLSGVMKVSWPHGSVKAERLRAPNSNSGVSDQQSVGSNPQL